MSVEHGFKNIVEGSLGASELLEQNGNIMWNPLCICKYAQQREDKIETGRLVTRYWMLGAGALGRPRGMEWGGRREEGSGWGTHVYLWWIHFDIWQK